ncbi:hypothetical protein [Bartonella sp. A05]|uniref:hypothetical protein n=1 Tax=Bartonella sp. A05 TaxID=2967261 RepID=UPI0022A8E097|nr:hypothetical protein [Bartonella sp. A05]MCZ2204272.1 hypothetical protein [Bartonella sp. A05]
MRENNMIDFEAYNDINSNIQKKTFLKEIYHSIRESALIGGINGSLSGAIAAILAAYGYISLPGFGPIIAMGTSVALPAGIIMGAMIGSIVGIVIVTVFSFLCN